MFSNLYRKFSIVHGVVFLFIMCASGQKIDPGLQSQLGRGTGGGIGWAVAVSPDGVNKIRSMPYFPASGRRLGGFFLDDGTPKVKAFVSNFNDDLNGASVAISPDGNTIASGAPNGDTTFLYSKGKGWKEEGNNFSFMIRKGMGTRLGASVALSGSTLVLGAPGEGRVHYVLSPAGSWKFPEGLKTILLFDALTFSKGGEVIEPPADAPEIKVGYLGAPNAGAAQEFGHAVSISRDDSTIIVGAPGDIGGGSVYIFRKPPAGWLHTETMTLIKSPEPKPGDRFGSSIAVSADGRSILVGAPGNNAAYLFRNVDPASQTPQTTSTIYTIKAKGLKNLGWAVAIAADGKSGGVTSLAKVDKDEGTIVWFKITPQEIISSQVTLAENRAVGILYGYSIAIRGDGKAGIVGAPMYDSGKGTIVRVENKL